MAAPELWKLVPSVPGLLASSYGRVMVEPFVGIMPHGGKRKYGGFARKGCWDGARFIFVWRGKTYKVGRLVCEAFNGPAPKGRRVCMHLDENSRNNLPENLQWGTQKENLNAPGFIAYCQSRTGDNSPYVKGRINAAQKSLMTKKAKMTLDFACRVLSVFNGFDGPGADCLWWRTDDEYAPVTFLVNCNDLFFWGCADAERITPENIEILEKAVADVKAARKGTDNECYEGMHGEQLFCCRVRAMRPQAACYDEKYYDKAIWPLFDAAGPERSDADGKRKVA